MSAPHSHVEQHEHVDGDADDEGLVRNVEGEVGDQHEEEGGHDGGDHSTLNPPKKKIKKRKIKKEKLKNTPRQVDLELQVRVVCSVAACFVLGDLRKIFKNYSTN